MPRKTRRRRRSHFQHRLASMRPRPDAAENVRYARNFLKQVNASMRPRPDAAENMHGRVFRADDPAWLQ